MHVHAMSLPWLRRFFISENLIKAHALFTFPQAQTQSPIGSRPRLHALPTKVTELTNLPNAPADASTKESLQQHT